MKPRDRISTAIRSAASHGDPALVGFLTAGHPRKETFRDSLRAVASGADVVEIGVPFTDPMADGVTIQRSSQMALVAGRDACAGFSASSPPCRRWTRRCC